MRYISLSLLSLALAGCGGGNSSAPGETPIVSDEVTLAQLMEHKPTTSTAPLQQVNQQSFLNHLKNGLFTATTRSDVIFFEDSSAPATPSAGSNGRYSGTNTQEQGVGEADRIKYDGERFYIAARQYLDARDDQLKTDYLKTVVDTDQGLNETQRLQPPADYPSIKGLYLNNQILTMLASRNNFGFGIGIEPFFAPGWRDNKFNVGLYNAANGETLSQTADIHIDGHLIDSRRIGNMLYLITSFTPNVPDIQPFTTDSAIQQQNFDRLQAATSAELLPHYSIGKDGERRLLNEQPCLIPSDAGKLDGYGNINTLVAIDTSKPDSLSTTCINAASNDLYVSTEAVFLTSYSWQDKQKTTIHYFPLQNGQPAYQASRTLDGGLGWSRPAFRMSHHKDQLRIVTTENTDGENLRHQLHILDAKPGSGALTTLATLPNDQHPDPLGKPGEDVYASRFFGDRAYLVTFERIDPLYVLDLSDGTDPKVLGELEIPGFSSYLHPIGDNYLLGVGQQVDPNRIGQPIATDTQTADDTKLEEGMKLSLFDIRDPASPIEVGKVVYANSYTPVEFDHHAFTSLPQGDGLKIALPVETVTRTEDNFQTQARLQLFEVTGLAGSATLVERGAITTDKDPTPFTGVGEDRSVLQDNKVYYLHGNRLLLDKWQ